RFAEFAGRTVALTNGAATNISPSISPTNVSETRAVGERVTTLFSSDPDGDTLTFSLVNDAGGLFRINGSELILNRALDYETATKHTITVKVSDGWGGDFVKELTINVTNSTTETNPLVKQGTNGSEQVVGENGNDKLYGLAGNDEIFGQGGDDMLWGGAGKDTYIGGAGRDIFVLDVKPSKSNLDWIYDFNVTDDTIHLSKKAFSKLARKGALSKDAFVVGDRVKDAEDRIIYHKKGGALFYDPDGTGSAKAIQFATIGKNLALKHTDFYVI
ncbi:MAG TPA: cadherin domain-containing protein, partial [Microvirga sp.]|nr:cadherin domain-containing protein [Microvirga sp.]